MLGLMVELFGATLGAVILGTLLYSLFRAAFGVFTKNLKTRYLISIMLNALCVVLFAAWGFANTGSAVGPFGPFSGPMNWMASLLYVPGLTLIAFVFYRRDVIVPAGKQDGLQN